MRLEQAGNEAGGLGNEDMAAWVDFSTCMRSKVKFVIHLSTASHALNGAVV